jgi:NAD(P)-dependent dehydrogenase (short-subunit alcohol dehydrogenase family)
MLNVLDRFSLAGKVAVVTGASSGLGAAFSMGLGQAGAGVVLGARRTSKLAATRDAVTGLGRKAIAVTRRPCRLPGAGRRDPGRTRPGRHPGQQRGRLVRGPATREAPEDFARVIDINLNGCYWMAQACGRVMQPGSTIINISSVLALTTAGLPQAAYAASKAGLLGLTRDLAQQWAGRTARPSSSTAD